MPDERRWNVFFSYASHDRAEVEELAVRTEDQGHLRVFLDKWRLVAGEPFIPALQEALRASDSCAVFIGKAGVRPWQNVEMEAALMQAVNRPQPGRPVFRVIPVLLPGAVELGEDEIPAFIGRQTWIDFRTEKGLDDPGAFANLLAGIRGVAPGKPNIAPGWLNIIKTKPLKHPTGLASDERALYVADHANGSILRIEQGQVVSSQTGLAKPHHVIVMGDTVVVADTLNHRLVFFDLELNIREDTARVGKYVLRRPHGLSSNYPNEFYVTDADNNRVLLVRNGEAAACAGRHDGASGVEIGEFSIPCGVAASPDCVFVADTFNHRVQVLTRDLRFLSAFGELGHGKGQFAYPVAVAAWRQWIVAADEHNKRLQLWRRETQTIPFEVRSICDDVCGEWLGSPFGLCFDQDGRLRVADRKEGNILEIDFERMLTETGASTTAGVTPD